MRRGGNRVGGAGGGRPWRWSAPAVVGPALMAFDREVAQELQELGARAEGEAALEVVAAADREPGTAVAAVARR